MLILHQFKHLLHPYDFLFLQAFLPLVLLFLILLLPREQLLHDPLVLLLVLLQLVLHQHNPLVRVVLLHGALLRDALPLLHMVLLHIPLPHKVLLRTLLKGVLRVLHQELHHDVLQVLPYVLLRLQFILLKNLNMLIFQQL